MELQWIHNGIYIINEKDTLKKYPFLRRLDLNNVKTVEKTFGKEQ